jgi:calcineurin-like phosphoesterase family protein
MKDIFDRIDENTWIISDTHIGHKNILEFEPSRLAQMSIDGYEAENHDAWIIYRWNLVVKPEDTILHIGDFAFKYIAETIEKLNGHIILILGNHDGKGTEQKYQGLRVIQGFYFEENEFINKIYHPIPEDNRLSGFIKILDGKKYLFSHYPVFDDDLWDRRNEKITSKIDIFEKIYLHHGCDFNVHGHIHSNKSAFDNAINACLEHIGFEPVRLGTLLKVG